MLVLLKYLFSLLCISATQEIKWPRSNVYRVTSKLQVPVLIKYFTNNVTFHAIYLMMYLYFLKNNQKTNNKTKPKTKPKNYSIAHRPVILCMQVLMILFSFFFSPNHFSFSIHIFLYLLLPHQGDYELFLTLLEYEIKRYSTGVEQNASYAW